MADVIVKQHVRRRTGKTAKVARALGIEPYIKVDSFRRRHPTIALPKGWQRIGDTVQRSWKDGSGALVYLDKGWRGVYYHRTNTTPLLISGMTRRDAISNVERLRKNRLSD